MAERGAQPQVPALYAGFPNAWNALATMKASLEGFDDRAEDAS
jgi:hypothetical protein